MDFNERLRRLGVLRGVAHLKPHPSTPAPARRRGGIEQWIRGQEVRNEHGAFFLADETLPLDHPHGTRPLSSLLDHAPDILARLTGDGSLTHLDLRRTAFIDTETTGLAGGTGTYAFLVGIGRFEDDHFRLRQYFMRDYDEEPAMLHHMAETLDTLTGLVTFNGKAFDLPLLETRFLLSRLRPGLLSAPHLDLLLPARCLWRARAVSCALSSLERSVLDVRRSGVDIPGFLIPAAYFNYLQTGDASEMSRVFYHNAQDILSMVTLTAQVCWLYHCPARGESAHGLDLLSLGRLCERMGLQCESEQAYRHALACKPSPEVRALVQEQLSLLCKRDGRWVEAVRLWEALHESGAAGIRPHVELAKYYEHRALDIDRAINLVLEAQKRLLQAGPRPAESGAELEYRLKRLRRKQDRREEST